MRYADITSIEDILMYMPKYSVIVSQDKIYNCSGSSVLKPIPSTKTKKIIHRALSKDNTTLFYKIKEDNIIQRYENSKLCSEFDDPRKSHEPLEYAQDIDTFILGKPDGSIELKEARHAKTITSIKATKSPITSVRYDAKDIYIGTKDGHILKLNKSAIKKNRVDIPFTPKRLGDSQRNYILEQYYRADASIKKICVLKDKKIAAIGKDLYILDKDLNLLKKTFFIQTFDLKSTDNIAIVNGKIDYTAKKPDDRIRMFNTETGEENSGIMATGLSSCITTEPFWFDDKLYVRSKISSSKREEVICCLSEKRHLEDNIRELLKGTTILQPGCRL